MTDRVDNTGSAGGTGHAAQGSRVGSPWLGPQELQAPGRLPARRPVRRLVIGAAIAAWLLAALLVAALLWRERKQEFEQTAAIATATTALMEAHTVNTLQAVDLALADIAGQLAGDGLPRHDPGLRADMQRRLAGMPYVQSMFVIGPDGFIQHDTDYPTTPDVLLADRDYFIAHRSDPQLERFFSATISSRSRGTWFVASTRRIGDGRVFRGIVVAAIRTEYFGDLYRRVGVAQGGRHISLFHRDGRLLAQLPQQAGEIGRSHAHTALFTQHLARSPAGVYLDRYSEPYAFDGLLSYAQVRGVPLVVTLAIDRSAMLSRWRSIAMVAVAGLLLLLVALALAASAFLSALAQRQRLRERQIQGEKMQALGLLTGSIAHDLGNLLGIVSGSLELVRRSVEPDGRAAAAVARAERAIGNGTQMTRQLLSFARERPLTVAAADMHEVVRSALPLLQQAAGSGIEIGLELPGGPAPARVDRVQLEVALINLVVNARDAMQQRGRIVVRVNALDRAVRRWRRRVPAQRFIDLSVQDDGPGMPEEVVKRAFEPFFTTKGEGGTGLGLPQVYALVQQLGGDVEIDSRPGQGTTVHLLLPAAAVGEGLEG
ncbi:ATP-binding protein [Ramlibacter tataouinensis]|uniref:sensor histidine kinase n=1 Tax=Ramlibacter tataouinensis TaxID=94132 RepID=UPI0022F3FDD8|nr:hybrid sensor histidine kinase/response regulator [Ramlibacter tataouinensis]WBY01918.1 ATP-binding protein [Ramlibacter tataouinensis]